MERIRKERYQPKKKWGLPSIQQKYSEIKLPQSSSALYFVEFPLGTRAWNTWRGTRHVMYSVRTREVAMGANVLKLTLDSKGEKASGNHQILLPRENAFLYQFFDLAGRAIVPNTSSQL